MRREPALVTDSMWPKQYSKGHLRALPDLPHQCFLRIHYACTVTFAGRLPLFFLPFIAVAGSYSRLSFPNCLRRLFADR